MRKNLNKRSKTHIQINKNRLEALIVVTFAVGIALVIILSPENTAYSLGYAGNDGNPLFGHGKR